MQHRSAMKACSLVLLLFTLSISASDDWNYHDQDDWVLVSKECGGASQSPINIHRDTLVVDEKLQLDFVNYNASILAFKAMNNYHSIKLNYIGDANSAPRVSGPAINFENYTLEQFHFHWGSKRGVGSEHVIDGLPYSMEMHLVHYNRAKYRSISKALESREGILVVAVLFKIHRENNPHFQELARLVSELKDRDQSYHIFTNKKYEDICPSTHNIDVPNVSRQDYQLIDIDDEFVSLMNDKGDTRDDLRLPEGELGDKIREEYAKDDTTVIVTVLAAVDEEAIIASKNTTN